MHDGGRRCGIGHHQVGGQGGQRRVGAVQPRVGLMGEGAGTGCAHAVHVDRAQSAQLGDQFGDVYAGSAIDLWWVFPSHHRHPHTRTVVGDVTARAAGWTIGHGDRRVELGQIP